MIICSQIIIRFVKGSLPVNQENLFKCILGKAVNSTPQKTVRSATSDSLPISTDQIGIPSPAVDKHVNLIIARHTTGTNTLLLNSSLPKASSTSTDVHEMQQHHFQNTIAKARQMPG